MGFWILPLSGAQVPRFENNDRRDVDTGKSAKNKWKKRRSSSTKAKK